jgi:hypothetical protein
LQWEAGEKESIYICIEIQRRQFLFIGFLGCQLQPGWNLRDSTLTGSLPV